MMCLENSTATKRLMRPQKELSVFDKRRCRKCKYYSKTSGAESCSYSLWTNNTCLQKLPDGSITDRRGDDPKHCRLYKTGKSGRTSDLF